MASGAARWRADWRHVLSIQGSGTAVEMKIRPAFEQSDTTIPAKNAVVVARRADFFRFRKASHGFFHQREESMRCIADEELGLGMAFVQQPGVVKPFVGIAQPLKDGLNLEIAIARGADKLVGDGETEHAASELMPGVNGEDVPANGLGLFGLSEITVKLDVGN